MSTLSSSMGRLLYPHTTTTDVMTGTPVSSRDKDPGHDTKMLCHISPPATMLNLCGSLQLLQVAFLHSRSTWAHAAG